jgi:hypothetical protein
MSTNLLPPRRRPRAGRDPLDPPTRSGSRDSRRATPARPANRAGRTRRAPGTARSTRQPCQAPRDSRRAGPARPATHAGRTRVSIGVGWMSGIELTPGFYESWKAVELHGRVKIAWLTGQSERAAQGRHKRHSYPARSARLVGAIRWQAHTCSPGICLGIRYQPDRCTLRDFAPIFNV